MRSAIIKNNLDDNYYRVSIVPNRKRASVPFSYDKRSIGEPIKFDNIIFEAAIFPKKKCFKPLFIIELDDWHEKKMSEDEFAYFVNHIIENEKIDNLMRDVSDTYKKYGFLAIEHDMWQFFFLSKIRFIFIVKDSSEYLEKHGYMTGSSAMEEAENALKKIEIKEEK